MWIIVCKCKQKQKITFVDYLSFKDFCGVTDFEVQDFCNQQLKFLHIRKQKIEQCCLLNNNIIEDE